MLFPALGMTAATWLMMVPLMGLESGLRADISVVSGILALPLAFASVWSFRAGIALTVLGTILCFIDLTTASSIGALANYAACGAALAIAGMAPRPVATVAVVAADEVATAPTRVVPERSLPPRSLAA